MKLPKQPERSREPKKSLKKTPFIKYYRSGSEASSQSPFQARPAKKRNFINKFVIASLDTIIIFIVIATLLYSLILKPAPVLNSSSDVYRLASVYQAAAISHLNDFKNKNKISFDEQELINDLQKKFPEIESGSVELPLFSQTPKIHLSISKPSFFLKSKGVTIVVDSQGTAIGEMNAFPKIKDLPVLIDESEFIVSRGKPAFSSTAVAFINTLIEQCRAAKIPIKSLTISNSPQEIDLRTSDQAYYTKFYLDGDSKSQVGQFLAARDHFKAENIKPGKYLDARVKGKIFYQ